MKLKLKICGMRDLDNIREIAGLKPDFLGFIFYENSPRYAGDSVDVIQKANLPSSIKKVGVYVNEAVEKILSDIEKLGLDLVQLHGQEKPEDCAYLRKKGNQVIKVFSVGDEFEFDSLQAYIAYVDFFLFDTKGAYLGGNGIPFNWQLMETYPYTIPFFLSGGIGPENIEQIRHLTHPSFYGIDVNSKLEKMPGIKIYDQAEMFKMKFDKLNDRSK